MRTGGSATIYGILHQILGAVRHTLELTLDAKVRGDEITSAQMVVEPEHGGDLVVERGAHRIVEQWKSRRSDRQWTIREIVNQVFPDLYRATNASRLATPTSYRFMVEGQVADSSAISKFSGQLRTIGAAPFSVEILDDSHAKPFLPGKRGLMTDRQFFHWVAERIAAAERSRDQSPCSGNMHRRLCHLLAHFEIVPSGTVADLEIDIDSHLQCLVGQIEDVAKTRHELCGRLMQLAKSGHATIEPTEFLRQAGLNAVSLKKWLDVRSKLNQQTYESVRALVRYEERLDVPRSLPRVDNRSILIIAGASGSGKSWQLASQIRSPTAATAAQVLIRARGKCEEDLQAAAGIVWHTGFEHDSSIPIGRLAERIRRCNSDLDLPWLILLIEDVRSNEELLALIGQPWSEWGIRLVVTVSERLGAWLAEQETNRQAEIHSLERFTLAQLCDYLRLSGRAWTGIPADVAEHLRLPLLASIYCQLNADSSWRPTSEYDVFARLWESLRTHPSQAAHPDDQPNLRDLAGSLLRPGADYPWPLRLCRDSGLDSDAITRLENLGWLSRQNGRVSMWHNRLLNWGVAEALSTRLKFGGEASVPEVCGILKDTIGEDAVVANQFLGYVFMDLLWMLSSSDHPQRSSCHHIIRAIEETWAPNGYPKALYQQSLPTLGRRIADGVVQRVCEPAGLIPDYLANLAGDALIAIGAPAAQESAELLLNESEPLASEVGLRVLAKHPAPNQLDKLWMIYKRLEESAGDSEETQHRRFESACADALRACAPLDLQWLRNAIHQDGQLRRLAWFLASILCSLQDSEAQSIWTSGSDILIEALHGGAEPLAQCIRRFRDTTKIPLMESWALSGDARRSVPGFETLCLLAPQVAISAIERIPAAQLGWWQAWFDTLYLALPDETRQAIRQIMKRSPSSAVEIGNVYRMRSHRLDVETLAVLFETLDKLLDRDKEHGAQPGPLAHLLGLLARISNVDLLDEFKSLRGAPLEAKLAERASRWLVDPVYPYDIELREAPNVLLRIGGTGHTQFVNAQLQHPNFFTAIRGLEAASIRPDEDRIPLLTALSDRKDESGGQGQPAGYLHSCAIEALAALGADRSLVLAIVEHGADVHGIRFLRGDRPPISDQDLAPALSGLHSRSDETRRRALFALGVSGRNDLIPRIKAAFAAPDATAEDRFGALWSLYGLEARDDESVALFSSQLNDPKCRRVAIFGLLQTERPDARERLVKELDKIDPDLPGGEGWLLAELSQHNDTRSASVQFAWKSYRERSFFHTSFRHLDLIRLLGEVPDPEVTDLLLQEADPSDRGMHVVGRRRAAIHALQKHDAEAAYEAAVAWLTRSGRDRHFSPALILGIDIEQGIPLLCRLLVWEGNRLVRRSICVALRHSGKETDIESQVLTLLQGDADERHAAAQIMQWMGPSFLSEHLSRHALHETIEHVRHAFLSATAAREREVEAGRVLRVLEGATGIDQWRLADGLFKLAEPEQLGRKPDPLWLGPISERFPPSIRQHTDKRWEEAQKQIQKDLERPGDD